ncbi:MAG: PIG-L family deacetylase, partial [Chloroflexi bacterium]|nr:PIG-L family deacetylase [Chloroflexota bacterium]
MSHIFVSPHPDDAALSCGGLIANLRELGQNVIILSVYSGHGSLDRLTTYQRQALGFGGKAIWPASQAFDSGSIAADHNVPGETADALAPWQAEPARLKQTQREADDSAKEFWQRASWYRRADISATSLPGGRTRDTSNGQGVIDAGAVAVAAAAGEAMAQRRQEDERYALFAEAAVV